MAGCTLGSSREVVASRSEEHTSELPSLMRISYAGFCLKKKKKHIEKNPKQTTTPFKLKSTKTGAQTYRFTYQAPSKHTLISSSTRHTDQRQTTIKRSNFITHTPTTKQTILIAR